MTRFGVELPIVQAGMGGGVAGAELAAAVSEAGGLGTIGFMGAAQMRDEIARARTLTARPVAANLLLPFARRAHWEAVADADIVTTFWGRPKRRLPRTWIHQCGSVEESRAAHAAGADGVICQGVEAGGHVRGKTAALELLEVTRAALPDGFPVLLAGGIAEAGDVRAALDAGAAAAVLGTRFLMSEESRAITAYKERLMESRETVLTSLFGVGWPAPHRVLWNEAAHRWLGEDGRPPDWLTAMHRATAPALSRLPYGAQARLARSQRADRPFFGPFLPAQGGPKNLLDAGALYAGRTVARIHDIRPAAEIVRSLV